VLKTRSPVRVKVGGCVVRSGVLSAATEVGCTPLDRSSQVVPPEIDRRRGARGQPPEGRQDVVIQVEARLSLPLSYVRRHGGFLLGFRFICFDALFGDPSPLTEYVSEPCGEKGGKARQRFGISIRENTTSFTVSLTKVRDRVRCMMSNLFRLRRLWSLVHPGTPMRFISLDQKPSWMNNAGRRPMCALRGARLVAAKENAAATRDRYTILTIVPSWPPPVAEPPKVCVLFRAKSGARIRAGLDHPEWMLIQFQENGSYRSENVVEAIRWALPPATRPEESVVVLLDWFSAHLTEEVQACIRELGHIVLYHGGGVTGVEQVF